MNYVPYILCALYDKRYYKKICLSHIEHVYLMTDGINVFLLLFP